MKARQRRSRRKKKNLELRESTNRSWMFWLQRRLLIKTKYWSLSSLFSPPSAFSSLYCWPPEEKRAQSLDGRSVSKWGTEVLWPIMNECVYLCLFWTGSIASYLSFILTLRIHCHCFSARLYTVAWRIRLGFFSIAPSRSLALLGFGVSCNVLSPHAI